MINKKIVYYIESSGGGGNYLFLVKEKVGFEFILKFE